MGGGRAGGPRGDTGESKFWSAILFVRSQRSRRTRGGESIGHTTPNALPQPRTRGSVASLQPNAGLLRVPCYGSFWAPASRLGRARNPSLIVESNGNTSPRDLLSPQCVFWHGSPRGAFP